MLTLFNHEVTSFHHIISHTLTCLSMTVSSEALGPHWPWHSRVDRWRAHLQCLPSGQGATQGHLLDHMWGDIDPGWIESLNSVLSREKWHNGWYWVVITVAHYVCLWQVEWIQCASVCYLVIYVRLCLYWVIAQYIPLSDNNHLLTIPTERGSNLAPMSTLSLRPMTSLVHPLPQGWACSSSGQCLWHQA